MNRRRDVTLPMLLLASVTVYGFLLVWAQTDTIELTTITGDLVSPVSPPMNPAFNIVSGGNVSIELSAWPSTTMVPAVTTPGQDTNMDSTTTAAASLNGATIPLPTAATNNSDVCGDTTTRSAARESTPQTTGSANMVPRSMKKSRAVTNFTGHVSIKVRIQSSAPKDEAMEMFLKKACEFFHTLQLEDVHVMLGPEKTPMLCLPPTNN
ncbi:uncharacterized protein LOC122938235 [Bufo gargarizans]|uniref:uncharacterized protein LOC122938235 n=1 Tax=Bufo gargarizans TaxID=30331 RepID=UPI001CF2FA8F|nr:uncharacterized protein LOC122938235 [Bufo gargarizans]